MSFRESYISFFRRFLPSPFIIAIALTIITLIWSVSYAEKSAGELLIDWQNGLWEGGLLAFAFQMMLMLVLGHVLALSSFFNRLVFQLIKPIKNTAQAAFVVTAATILVALLNWGLGLIFGAILARKIGEKFTKEQKELNYPLIAAGGYVGLMVWHGGISGSALAKVSEPGHLRAISGNMDLPNAITYVDTVFSSMNIVTSLLLLILIPSVFYLIGRKTSTIIPNIKIGEGEKKIPQSLVGAEKLENLSWFSKSIGIGVIAVAGYIVLEYQGPALGFINPNFINFTLLGLGLLLHQNFAVFTKSVEDAIRGASGILIQFPLYFGILALMKAGGLIELISSGFIAISTPESLPLFTFLSAGLVNVFVPSGGGQWAIQGPIILEAASHISVPLNKMIMALAYGDQLTNMLQPFWALPLLSITGLKAKDILPYTLILFILGLIIFSSVLLLF